MRMQKWYLKFLSSGFVLASVVLCAACSSERWQRWPQDLGNASSDNTCKSFDISVTALGVRVDKQEDQPLARQIQFVVLLEGPIKDLPVASLAQVTYEAVSGRLKVNIIFNASSKNESVTFEGNAGCSKGVVLVRRTIQGGSGESVTTRVDSTVELNFEHAKLLVSVDRKFGFASKFEQSQDIRRAQYSFPVILK